MEEKYGFVYIWFDRKHKRYYIGSHWGSINDGYVCSSSWMMQAYKRRPNDFKRKILSKISTNRKDLLDEEYRWFCFIKDDEIGKRYYNLNVKSTGHWAAYPENVKTIKEKISLRTKEAMQRPEIKEKMIKGIENRDNRSSDIEVRKKRSKSMIGKNKNKQTVKDKNGNIFHTTKDDPRWKSGDIVGATMGIVKSAISEKHKDRIKEVGVFRNMNNVKQKCLYCDFVGNIGNLARYHNNKCKHIEGVN